ncbi:MAG: M1 family metallopeptidase [Hyphomonadaceae bacterium]
MRQTKGDYEDKFRQLEEDFPTPNESRLASGAPGPDYWQQQVDYKISVELDEAARRLTGSETIRYTNNSPHTLTYLWLQLDQNRFTPESMDNLTRTSTDDGFIAYYNIRRAGALEDLDGGYKISNVRAVRGGAALNHTIRDTNMRIDLPRPLKPGDTFEFALDFNFNMYDTGVIGGRAGYECFDEEDEDGNCIFLGAQWFPRLHAYSDYEGWHNKPFLGSGEFTLEFGDYEVEITVPSDHIVSATGELQNERAVLTAEQRARLNTARDTEGEITFIVSPEEARANEEDVSTDSKTWVFEAENVRDFAFASSRKFIWDAMNVEQINSGGEDVLAMSFYPNEAEPLWSAYSTKSIAHTIEVYSRFSFPYPYPTSQSVNGPVGGMEYPMITFNGPRPVKDDDGNLTYSSRTKHGLITVIIHEVGHNYFPMIVNSDERQWTWMDEGINSFLQFVAEKEWDEDYPSRSGEARSITEYMKSEFQVPIMTQSDSIIQFGNNAYNKPSVALNILRETIMGRDAFDTAFEEFSRNWKFKRPAPSDFFRSMEEGSGIDLDWFWRGWFYTTDHVDISLDNVTRGSLNTGNPEIENVRQREERAGEPLSLTVERNRNLPKAVDTDPSLRDFYNEYDEFSFGQGDIDSFERSSAALEDWERAARDSTDNFYYLTFSNKGGLVMPLIVEMTYADGDTEILRIPAEIWRRNSKTVTKLVVSEREIVSIELDPRWETADTDRSNNAFPRQIQPSRLENFQRGPRPNLMDRLDFKVEPTGLTVFAQEQAEESDEDSDDVEASDTED